MSWRHRNLHWVLLTLVVVTTIATMGLFGASLLVLVAGFARGASAGTLLTDAAVVIGVMAVFAAADIALALALAVTAVRRASIPRSDELAGAFSVLERLIPQIRSLGLADRFAPTTEERKQKLKRRYVDGERTEREFEREMHALLVETEPDRAVDQSQIHPSPDEPATGSDREIERE